MEKYGAHRIEDIVYGTPMRSLTHPGGLSDSAHALGCSGPLWAALGYVLWAALGCFGLLGLLWASLGC